MKKYANMLYGERSYVVYVAFPFSPELPSGG